MNSGVVPYFIKAKSPERLSLLMLQNNIENGTTFKYFDISFVKGYWFAWYYRELEESLSMLTSKE